MSGTPLSLRVHGAARTYGPGRTAYDAEAEVAAGMARVRPVLGYRVAASPGPGSAWPRRSELRFGGYASTGAGGRTPWPIRRLFIRTALGYDVEHGRAQELQLGFNRLVAGDKSLDANYRRDLRSGVDQLELGLHLNLAHVRAATIAHRTRSGSSIAQTITGTAGFDREDGQVLFTGRSGLGQAGALISLYLDENGNELRDPGEELIPGVRLRFDVDAHTRERRSTVVHASDLSAYRRYVVTIDPNSLPNPMVSTRFATFAFVADPNRFKRIDIPFFVGGAVGGTMLRRSHGSDRPVPGLRILLRSSDGAFVAVLPVFADGTFYHLGLAPGLYHAEVDPAQLDFLGVRSEPLAREFKVRTTREGDFLEGIDFLLVPALDPPIQTGREAGR